MGTSVGIYVLEEKKEKHLEKISENIEKIITEKHFVPTVTITLKSYEYLKKCAEKVEENKKDELIKKMKNKYVGVR